MEAADVYNIAEALAVANGHPDPSAYAQSVEDIFSNGGAEPEAETNVNGDSQGGN